MAYESLAELIEPYVDESFVNLPTFLQERVTEDFFPMPHWDVLAPEQRRSLAQQHDGRHDPAKEPENAHYWNIGCLIEGKKKEFEKWESMPEPIPSEAILKEQRLHTLRGELAALESRFNEPYQAPPGQDTATPAPVVAASVVIHSTKARRNTLTPVIEFAQKNCRNPLDTAEVWAALLVLAENKHAPLIGATEEGLQHYEGGEVAIFKRKSLGKRLAR